MRKVAHDPDKDSVDVMSVACESIYCIFSLMT